MGGIIQENGFTIHHPQSLRQCLCAALKDADKHQTCKSHPLCAEVSPAEARSGTSGRARPACSAASRRSPTCSGRRAAGRSRGPAAHFLPRVKVQPQPLPPGTILRVAERKCENRKGAPAKGGSRKNISNATKLFFFACDAVLSLT